MAVLFAASMASAAVTWTVNATTSDGSPLTGVTVGAQIILDITARTDDFAFGLAGSVNNYDNSIIGLDAGSSLIPLNLFNQVCVAPGSCFGGIENQVGGAITFQENAVGPGVEAEFFAGLALTAAGGQGELDQGAVTGVAGDPQIRVIYDALAAGTTTLQIGTYAEYLDGYTGTVDSLANNTTLVVTVPEAGAMASSLAALGSVFAVVGIRRRG
jgi:hypothetical protein